MLTYIFKRLLFFVPTLIVISLASFGLSKMVPGNPVDAAIGEGVQGGIQLSGLAKEEELKDEYTRMFGLDKPVFYFSLSSIAYPDTLHRILRLEHRESLSHLVEQYGNWPQIETYYHQINQCRQKAVEIDVPTHRAQIISVTTELLGLPFYSDHKRIVEKLEKLETLIRTDSLLEKKLASSLENLKRSYNKILSEATPNKHYFPDFKWYGFDNQYHNWMKNFVTGHFGISYIYKRPVGNQLREAVRWTILLNVISILFAYIISIPLGVYSAVYQDSIFDKVTTFVLFAFYSLPVFWVATMLLVFLTTPEYGMDCFPTLWTQFPEDMPFWEKMWGYTHQLTLPVFCLTYAALAFITRQMRGGVLNIIREDYIRTARAKGLSERRVIWKHVFRNSLSPIITLFASVFPATFAGSVVIERIFTIPGMGNLALDSIQLKDWPVVYAVLMLGALLTMVGILISDLLYAQLDPRVNFNKRK